MSLRVQPAHEYQAAEHDPMPFLGQVVPLPELADYPQRGLLENPVACVEDMLAFARMADLFGCGYDGRIARAHWGVWQARHLEAMFWRLQDAASAHPLLSHGWGDAIRAPGNGGGPVQEMTVYLDSYSPAGRTWLRQMGIAFSRPLLSGDEHVELPRESEWPCLPEEDHILGLPGVAERQAFWRPLSAYSVGEALDAFDATRWGKRRFRVPVLSTPGADPCPAFAHAFGPGPAAALAAYRRAHSLDGALAAPVALPQPTPRL